MYTTDSPNSAPFRYAELPRVSSHVSLLLFFYFVLIRNYDLIIFFISFKFFGFLNKLKNPSIPRRTSRTQLRLAPMPKNSPRPRRVVLRRLRPRHARMRRLRTEKTFSSKRPSPSLPQSVSGSISQDSISSNETSCAFGRAKN